ncbi:MAG: CRISPR-associated protein Csx20, partial [Pseudomonadota bacterium]
SLGVTQVVNLPAELRALWSNIPPSLTSLSEYLASIRAWLVEHAAPGDYVLIQGDFGATYLIADFALRNGLVAVYSTTTREATETIQPDGTVELMHHFKHQIYRNYGG